MCCCLSLLEPRIAGRNSKVTGRDGEPAQAQSATVPGLLGNTPAAALDAAVGPSATLLRPCPPPVAPLSMAAAFAAAAIRSGASTAVGTAIAPTAASDMTWQLSVIAQNLAWCSNVRLP